jgi:hypothetical protein
VVKVTSDSDTGRRESGFSPIVTLGALVGLTAAALAGATVWLVVTNPVGLVEALDGGQVSPLVLQIASALYDLVVRLLGYL